MNGKQLDKIIRDTFKLEPDQPITVDQLNYVLGIIDPVSYILQHHTINGKPLTFTIPDHDTNKAL